MRKKRKIERYGERDRVSEKMTKMLFLCVFVRVRLYWTEIERVYVRERVRAISMRATSMRE